MYFLFNIIKSIKATNSTASAATDALSKDRLHPLKSFADIDFAKKTVSRELDSLEFVYRAVSLPTRTNFNLIKKFLKSNTTSMETNIILVFPAQRV
jgi:hypothetical protein